MFLGSLPAAACWVSLFLSGPGCVSVAHHTAIDIRHTYADMYVYMGRRAPPCAAAPLMPGIVTQEGSEVARWAADDDLSPGLPPQTKTLEFRTMLDITYWIGSAVVKAARPKLYYVSCVRKWAGHGRGRD